MIGNNSIPMFIPSAVYDETKALGTANSNMPSRKLTVYGHIVSFLLSVSLAVTKSSGTVDTTKSALDSIKQFTLYDKNNKVIYQWNGNRTEKFRKLLSLINTVTFADLRKGTYTAPTALSNATGTYTYQVELPASIRVADQPIRCEIQVGTLSDVFSAVSGDSASLTVTIIPVTFTKPVALDTVRATAFDGTSISAEQDVLDKIPSGVDIRALAVDVTADANLTDITLKPSASDVGLESVPQIYLEMWETRQFVDGHLAGFHILPVVPFKVNDSTVFKINPASAVTPVFYVLYTGVR